jgi:hypothetical protein
MPPLGPEGESPPAGAGPGNFAPRAGNVPEASLFPLEMDSGCRARPLLHQLRMEDPLR